MSRNTMLIGIFTLYLFSLVSILLKKRKMTLIFTILALGCAVLLFWYHEPNNVGIRL